MFQNHLQQQLHRNHMGIEKTHLLVRKSVCWRNMNTDVDNTNGCKHRREHYLINHVQANRGGKF